MKTGTAIACIGLFALIGFVVWVTGDPAYLWALLALFFLV